ncbi:MAG: hypothetical protein ABL997_10270, partial [Planctomycetota bacterium]
MRAACAALLLLVFAAESRAASPVSAGAPCQQAWDPPSWEWVASLRHGAPVEGGGTIVPSAVIDPAVVARGGRIAFVARFTDPNEPARNHGVFTADHLAVRAIAIGCGRGGGSGEHGSLGDPAPGGGRFAGLFSGTAMAPAIADDGSVLFVADLVASLSPRALFRHDASTRRTTRLVAVGDPTPLGGTFVSVGPGVHGPRGSVWFVAQRQGTSGGELFVFDPLVAGGGAVRPFACVGDPLPGGGAIALLATEIATSVDGSSMAIGPLPFVDACGTVAFRVHGGGGAPQSGIVVRKDGQDAWWLRTGDATPQGGVFTGFGGPVLGGEQLAVYAEHSSGRGPTAGWFVGRPGAWRRAIGFFDPVDGGQCLSLAMSRAPMTPLDDRGDLVVWCAVDLDARQDRIVLCRRSGAQQVLARRGDPVAGGGSFGGGSFGELGGWPSLDGGGRCVVSAQVQFALGTSGYFTLAADEPRLAVPPCASIAAEFDVQVSGPFGSHFALAASTLATEVPLPPFGMLRIGPD